MIKVKKGAISKEINEGALKWYKMAGWKIIKSENKDKKNDKADSQKTITE